MEIKTIDNYIILQSWNNFTIWNIDKLLDSKCKDMNSAMTTKSFIGCHRCSFTALDSRYGNIIFVN